ncbi:hypothetical protein IFM89_008640 [Coptis chinensis]|uniref:Glycosyl transferase family 1 domain-containing protein n=1 Tax=Coptis chinensis TaxID=261450 RepID=A0A835HC04_9MAGN|nr:hypothetical protein IFM89_008640 [Coptis chinensis]
MGRFLSKRNHHREELVEEEDGINKPTISRNNRPTLHHNNRRKNFLTFFKGMGLFYFVIGFAIIAFIIASMLLQSRIGGSSNGSERGRSFFKHGLKFGGSFRFLPGKLLSRFDKHGGLDRSRRIDGKVGLSPPRLAIVLGRMKRDSSSLMLFTVLKSLKGLGYGLKIYAVEDGNACSLWEQIGGQLSILGLESMGRVDWSIYEGIIVDSLEAKEGISSLMQDPFCSIPLIWIVQEDILAKRLPVYIEMGWEHLIVDWRSAFSRADVIVFPDFSLPMLYSVLDTGNFFVIPGSPVEVWEAERYMKSHSKSQLRNNNGFLMDDLVVLIVGSSFFYDKLSWDYAVAMHAIGPLLMKVTRKEADLSFKFVFLCGNSTDGYNDALQEISSRLGLPHGSLVHYGLNGDVNSALLMADIVLHGSFQDEQGFPPLLTRAMSFGIPVIVPDLPIIKKYVVDEVHGLIYQMRNPDTLMRAFSLLVTNGKLSKFAHLVASSGKMLAKNMLASESVYGFAKLLENVLHFPSDVFLPDPCQLQPHTWEWTTFRKEMEQRGSEVSDFDVNNFMKKASVVYSVEEEYTALGNVSNMSKNETDVLTQETPTKLDWEILKEMEDSEDSERLEAEQLEERMEKTMGSWEEIYRTARKAEKLKFEVNERDEGELERIGQQLCIYEIYTGAGAWPFLRHGSLYRGLSLSARARRPRSDDVDAVLRLPLLNDTYYQNLLCELGGMFSIANRVDNIHNVPWIGFQSWHAAGRKVSLSGKSEIALEETIQAESEGDVIYYWARLELDNGNAGGDDTLTFWSLCDILNGGQCRTAFADAFRQMYGLSPNIEALPPMPDDGGHWSALHSWVMPTPSFLEYMMFSRMFVDSLDSLNNERNTTTCLLGSSELEKRHCYCRMLELLVNVWAYHSARRMVYMDPSSGLFEEQHLIEQRKGFMWVKFFNFTLLKNMDEDLAEAADDDDHIREGWLWPYTGEVHWKGIYEREREERYRQKMDKKRKTKEKLLERQKYGYRQKTLGG